jgi:hypothetical protein
MQTSSGAIVFVVAVMLAAFVWETLKWRRKSHADLEKMIQGRDWRYWKTALKELKRRGEDIERFVPLLLSRMLTDKRMRREAARITLSDTFPYLRPELKPYSSADDPAISRDKLAPLVARFPLPDPSESDLSETGFVL